MRLSLFNLLNRLNLFNIFSLFSLFSLFNMFNMFLREWNVLVALLVLFLILPLLFADLPGRRVNDLGPVIIRVDYKNASELRPSDILLIRDPALDRLLGVQFPLR